MYDKVKKISILTVFILFFIFIPIFDIGIVDFPKQSFNSFPKKPSELDLIENADNATQLNGSIQSLYEIKIYRFDALNITFNYTDINTNTTIENASANFTWYNKNNVSSYGNGTLIELGNGLYTLDFNTSSRELGEYVINIYIKKDNCTKPNMIVLLLIERRPTNFVSVFGTSFKFERGSPILLFFHLKDSENETDLNDFSIKWFMGYFADKLIPLSKGVYSLLIPSVGFEIGSHLLVLDGSDNLNYEISISTVLVEITWEKILGIDVPVFYAILIIIIAVGVGIIIYKFVQRAKIPFFIKKIDDSLKKVGSKVRPISTIGLRSREEIYTELFEKEFKLIGKKPNFKPSKTKDVIKKE